MALFEWWAGLDSKIRYGVAIAFLLTSTVALYFGRLWYAGWVIGGLLLLVASPSDSEKKGYRF